MGIFVHSQTVRTKLFGKFITTVYSPSAIFVIFQDPLCVTVVLLTVSPLTVTRLIVLEVIDIWVVDWFSITPDTVPLVTVLPFTCVPVEPDVLPEEISNGASVVPIIVVVLGFTRMWLISVQLQLVIIMPVERFITTVYSPSAMLVKDHDPLCVTVVVLIVSPLPVTSPIVIEVLK